MIEPAFFAAHRRRADWIVRSAWPFAWISGDVQPPAVCAYRLEVDSLAPERLRVIVSADERYRLFCDGRLVGSGPAIGTRLRWQADAYDLDLAAGPHRLLAVVWSVGAVDGDFATDGIAHGFALGVDGEANPRFATGTAPWQWHALPGYRFRKSHLAHWTVPDLHRDAAASDWAAEAGAGEGWQPARVVSPVHHVAPVEAFPARLVEVSPLPPPLHRPWTDLRVRHAELLPAGADTAERPLGDDDAIWRGRVDGLLRGGTPLRVPAGRTLRAVVDCGTYLTAWPEVAAGGAGGTLDLRWMEALSLQPVRGSSIPKGDRSAIAGRYTGGPGDTLALDAAVRDWRPLFWRSGRFLVVTATAGADELALTTLCLTETRYPLEQEARLEVDDPALAGILPLCLRTLQANASDQFTDTPYYERMQYLGDARLDCLNSYILTRDARLAAKALRMVDSQVQPGGLTVSRCPTRNLQVIPPFSLWYVGMVHDHAWWRGDAALVRQLMPGVRGVLDAFLRHRAADGTIGAIEGWNFCDWAAGFPNGEPPGSAEGSGPLNLQVLIALGWAEELELALDEPELAARWRRIRLALAAAVQRAFWDDAAGAWTDRRGGGVRLSRHAQALAALCPDLDAGRVRRGLQRMDGDPALVQASLYFTHYLIEAWARHGQGGRIRQALDFWTALPAQGFVTLPEQPEPSRSDCHAWCAHPLFHVAATIAGIRPAGFGFARVRVAPCPGPLPSLAVRIPHPGGGWVGAELAFAGGAVRGEVTLPDGVDGVFAWGGAERPLRPGLNRIG